MPPGLFSEQESRYGIHGGDAEASLILAMYPTPVDMAAARDFRSTAETAPISPIGPTSLAWVASDLNTAGALGEAHLATAEKGDAAIAHIIPGVIDLLRKVAALPLDGYAPATHPA